MDAGKEEVVTIVDTKSEIAQARPTTAEVKIHWATPASARPDLEEKFEAMRARNWITDRMVQQYQKHWHCSREVALERLLAKASI